MIVVVEPHADDAWLSVGQHVVDWVADGQRVVVATIYGNARRSAEAARWAEHVGAEHVAVGVPEAGAGLGGEWTTELPSSALPVALLAAADRVVGPLGIQHPEHRAVAVALERHARRPVDRYLELPYARKQRNVAEVNALVEGRPVSSMRVRSARVNAASSIFASQSTFWLYNREAMVGAVEVVVTDP